MPAITTNVRTHLSLGKDAPPVRPIQWLGKHRREADPRRTSSPILPDLVLGRDRNDLRVGLAVGRTAGPGGHTNSPHPSSREGHHSTTRWNSSFLLSRLILRGSHAAAASRVHRNSVPSTQMRCMITAKRRASATMAFFIPRCLAIFMAHALSQDHFAKRTSTI